MYRVALKMLFGDKAKFLALALGLSFAVLLIAQQGSIFLGLLLRATGFLQNISQPQLWVADPDTRYIGELRAMDQQKLLRVRSVPGVAWAEPLFSSRATVELPGGDFKTAQLLGIDRNTFIGQPPRMTEGRIDDLRQPSAVVVAETARDKLGGVERGDVLMLNDRRARIVGFFQARLGFESNALIYTTYRNALDYVPTGRDRLSFMMIGVKPDASVSQVQSRINRIDHIGAFTPEAMRWRTIMFILQETGIGINFGITVSLGFVVGLVVSAAIFYQFTVENLRYFAVLKAMGARHWLLVKMILLQAISVGLIGYGMGVGGAGAFSLLGRPPGTELSTYFPWQLLVGALVAMIVCVSAGSLLSLRRVLALEPAIVFK
jgi:putative ABC transport system permease protein